MFRRFALAALVVLALICLPRPASASSVTFVESTYGLNFGCVGAACLPVDGLSNNCLFCYASTTSTGLLIFGPQTFTNPAVPGASVTYAAQSQTSAGSLHATASASYIRPTTATDSRFIYSSSIYRELLTVNSATLDGQAGTLLITFHLDGTLSETGTGNALAYVGLGAGTTTNPEAYGEQFVSFGSSPSGTVQVNQNVTLSVPIVYGREFLLSAVLGAFAGGVTYCAPADQGTASCPLGVMGYATTGTGGGSASFFNTLQLTGLTPNAADPTFLSGSGTPYDTTGVVPEPGTFVLLATGLMVAVVRARRRSAVR